MNGIRYLQSLMQNFTSIAPCPDLVSEIACQVVLGLGVKKKFTRPLHSIFLENTLQSSLLTVQSSFTLSSSVKKTTLENFTAVNGQFA